jgi:aminopeptidase
MDDRIEQHAELLVDWSAQVESGENVVVQVEEGTHDLAVAVAAALGDRGATPLLTYRSDEAERAFLRNRGDDVVQTPEHEVELYRQADSVLILYGGQNLTEQADVPSTVRQAYDQARSPAREARMASKWMSTVHPTRALAQNAGISYEAYRNFVYEATLRDWEALANEMAQLKTLLDEGDEVRLVKPDTDVRMRIDGRTAVNSAASVRYDSHNLPSGEVFTAPYATEGSITFDVPMLINDRVVANARLVFEDGEVVDWSADRGETALTQTIETDDGARRLGEVGIGMNRGIQQHTNHIIFDEKIAGTAHLALGRAYDANLPEGVDGNDSAVHVDLITDMNEDAEIRIDETPVMRNGRFCWEDGFSE